MNAYSVKQIAEMLNTNPETVRRWIREKKLTAIQISRKSGNVVTEDDLQRFLKVTPKYASRFAASINLLPAGIGLVALLGSLGLGAIDYYEGKKDIDYRILPKDIQNYLYDTINKLEEQVAKKNESIQQLQEEVADLQRQIGATRYLLEHNSFALQEPIVPIDGNQSMEGK